MAYTVTITGTGDGQYCYVKINNTPYVSAATVSVEEGTAINCFISRIAGQTPTITYNGSVVASGDDKSYTFTVVNDVKIVLDYGVFDHSNMTITMEETPPDPLAPKDGHNTLVSGAACQIEGGTAMVGGTAYELESGTVVIGGTVHEIPLAGGTCTVTITGSGRDGFCYVEIDGQSYMSANVVEVAKGTEIECAAAMLGKTHGYIYLNGVLVASTESGKSPATYQYTVRWNVSIELRITDTTSNQKRSIYIVDT